MEYDLIIKNGRIIDGTGNPWYYGELGIKDGKIVKISAKIKESAEKEVNANGMIISPGFIDIHSHTDFILPFYSRVESFIRQGITTIVGGNCGQGLAPIAPEKMDDVRKLMMSFLAILKDYNFKWNTFKEYLEFLEKLRCPANLILFVGYSNLRICGGAGFENRSPTKNELEKMKEYIGEAMEAGAFGMSTGLIYAPQVYATTAELIELGKKLAEYNGLYFTHMRNEGRTVREAVKEVIEIVEKSGCAGGHIAHHKISGRLYWGTSKDTLKLIEDANAKGISITFDQYPYNRGLTSLRTVLPPWVHEGGTEKILERIKNQNERERIKKDIKGSAEGWENFLYENPFECFYIAAVDSPKWKEIQGKNLSEITKIKGKKDEWETLFEILIDEEGGGTITIESMGEEDIKRIMTNRYQMVGTDGAAIPANPGLGTYHPRFYGTYPRILGKYVREEKLLTPEDAIRRMTSFPAQRLGLLDRGLIKERMCADLVIFDPKIIIDKATYTHPHQLPDGIPYVIVNGVIVVEDNSQNRKHPGKVLRHQV
jgi:N-acyl-D-amino-acid deacylase